MTRPHEDLERHTPADHRPGGVPITFAPGAWCAIDIAHLKADRVDAGIAAYETLIEKARTSSVHVRVAVVLRSANDRRVISLIEIGGHDAFHHLQTAWDDHHLLAERHAVAESSTLGLYRLAGTVGVGTIDPTAHDVWAFAHLNRGSQHALAGSIESAEGFRGAIVFGSDDASASVIVYRFTHASSAAAQLVGETAMPVHPVRTFG
jgi:hypothetical protein